MKTNERFFKPSLTILTIACSILCTLESANAARVSRTPIARASVTAATQSVKTTQSETANEETTQQESEIITNKSSQFSTVVSESTSSAGGKDTSFADEIDRQRAALAASEAKSNLQASQRSALASGSNACDSALRNCMQKTCGEDFLKCALDGDTIFGDKLNKCKRDTTCTTEEFTLFAKEIKADRDMNAKLSSYNAVINCGNEYNSCIQNECGQTFSKCLGKNFADAAIKKCETIAKNCKEQDSGLASRFGVVIGKLRGAAEKDIKTDEERMYKLRELMSDQCKLLGATFDERSFDCVYSIKFYTGSSMNGPTASRKAYAGDSFICMQEFFGVNATTFKENAYRETRSQTGASSAMLGSGVGSAVGMIASGALDRAIDTKKAKDDLKDECASQGLKLKNGKCVEKTADDTETQGQTRQQQKELKESNCGSQGGTYKAGSCWCGSRIMKSTDRCSGGKIEKGAETKIDQEKQDLSDEGIKNIKEEITARASALQSTPTPVLLDVARMPTEED